MFGLWQDICPTTKLSGMTLRNNNYQIYYKNEGNKV